MAGNVLNNQATVRAAVNRPLMLHSARNTSLLRSGLVFYPSEDQIDPDVLPRLSDAQIAFVEEILLAEARNLQQAQRNHANFLMSRFPGHDAARVPAQVQLTPHDGPQANSDSETGDVQVSARVVQATFRAALVATFYDVADNQGTDTYGFDPVIGDGAPGRDPSLIAIERRSFQAYRLFRQRLTSMRSFTLLNDLNALRSLETASRALDESLMDSGTILVSHQLEAAFLNAIRFMLAHELAHVALRHPKFPARCEEARANEAVADRYATILSGLAAYERATPIVLANGSSRSFWRQLTPMEELVNGPADGAGEFFRFSYTLSGFSLALARLPNCEYPGPRARFATLAPYSHVYFRVFQFAQTDQALRRYGDRATKRSFRTTNFFDRYFAALPQIVAANNESLEQDNRVPEDLEAERPALSEIYHAVFTPTRP